jgi:hypothetical protein
MAGARLALSIQQRVVRQFDRNVIFCRNRLATFAAFGRRTLTAARILERRHGQGSSGDAAMTQRQRRSIQSSFNPIARITLERVSAYARAKAANSCGEFENAGSMPALRILSRRSWSDSAALMAALSLSITSRGVPAGATMLC